LRERGHGDCDYQDRRDDACTDTDLPAEHLALPVCRCADAAAGCDGDSTCSSRDR
jgi:hypothetical protein